MQTQRHVCKACHNASIASKAGKRGGPVSGRQAVETGQINQFIAAGIAASQASPTFQAAISHNGVVNGLRAVETGQLAQARLTAHTPEALNKSWETRKENGTLKVSEPERRFVGDLQTIFGEVQTQLRVDGYYIDAYVPSNSTYVQFDGCYYHGLDRPYAELNSSQKAKYDRDRQVDQHFAQTGRTLLRVTDAQYEGMTLTDIQGLFTNSIG